MLYSSGQLWAKCYRQRLQGSHLSCRLSGPHIFLL